MQRSIEEQIKERIFEHGRGWCFTVSHFTDLGSDASIRKALSNLQKQEVIRRLTQGIYDYPEIHPVLGVTPPDLNKMAQTIAEKNGAQIQPAGAYAAHLVGISGQVPGRIIFLTEGPSKKVQIGNQEIIFKKTTKKVMFPAGTKEGLVIQALKNFGQEHINGTVCKQIADFLRGTNIDNVRTNVKYAPAWIRVLILRLWKRND